MAGSDEQDRREAALHDPLRSLGGQHEAGRLKRGVAEFLRLPLLLTVGFAVLGVLVGVLDRAAGDGAPLRELASALVSPKGAVDFISAVATSVVTVTSITFSVLLLAVQQTASSLTAVVFDQFLRRTSNQVYFGFFVGLSAFSFVVLGASRPDPAPVYGAAIVLVLTLAALVVLLLLIHGSIDQMRPQSVVRSIHELALRARERELVKLGRTRPEPTRDGERRRVVVDDSGFVVTVDIDRLARAARDAGPDVEVVVVALLGDYVAFGDTVATIVGVDPDDGSWDEQVVRAFGIDDIRDVDAEAGYATDQLANIAWVAASSSQQNPHTATIAVRALRDLMARWLVAGERDRSGRSGQQDERPVVYSDGVTQRVMQSLANVVVATAESRQGHTCAEIIRAFTSIAPRLRNDRDRAVYEDALDSMLGAVIQHAEIVALRNALAELEDALRDEGLECGRVGEVRTLLSAATQRLLPKGSDEPEAAHPAGTGVASDERAA
jgi:uncharacterized membrane protein